ncbi:MAG: ABC transporter permease, partial [Clostridia bacterium]|nr:ABC transporter permease [Clostridia bacterium]
MAKTTHEPLFHLTKRTEFATWKAMLLRVGAFFVSVFVCAVVTTLLTDNDLSFFFKYFFDGLFGTKRNIWNLFHETAILLLVALAVTPCFKMKFWNIGAEGQVLIGG